VTHEIARFARRRPGAFLAAAVAGGLAAGRLMRSMKDTSGQSSSTDTTSRSLSSGTGRPYGVDAPPLTTGAALGGPPGHGLPDDTGLGIGEPDVGAPPVGGPAIISPAVGEPNGPGAGGVI